MGLGFTIYRWTNDDSYSNKEATVDFSLGAWSTFGGLPGIMGSSGYYVPKYFLPRFAAWYSDVEVGQDYDYDKGWSDLMFGPQKSK